MLKRLHGQQHLSLPALIPPSLSHFGQVHEKQLTGGHELSVCSENYASATLGLRNGTIFAEKQQHGEAAGSQPLEWIQEQTLSHSQNSQNEDSGREHLRN